MAYFLRQTKRKNGDVYLQIYDSYYSLEEKRNKNRSIKKLGNLSELKSKDENDDQALERLKQEMTEMEPKKNKAKISDEDCQFNIGYFLMKSIQNKMKADNKIDFLFYDRRNRFSLSKSLFDLAFARVVRPCSKTQTINRVFPSMYGLAPVTRDQLYESLDQLGERYEEIVDVINEGLHEINKDRHFSHAYFDCTNYYFEIDLEDDLRRKGPSKENRKDPIVGMALLLDEDCVPAALRIYPGNESEKPYLPDCVDDMKKRLRLTGKIIEVADKGLNCAENIVKALGKGNGYIFSKSLKMMSKDDIQWVFDDGRWTDVTNEKGELIYQYKEAIGRYEYTYECDDGSKKKISLDEKRIVTYNPSLARKQKAEICRRKEKAMHATDSDARKEKFGDNSAYIETVAIDKTTGEINEGVRLISLAKDSKIMDDMRIAGYNMLVTSEMRMKAKEIYEAYHQLWNIERTFRVMKTQLEARPVYVNKENSIKGHFLSVYLAVVILRVIQKWMFKDRYSIEQIAFYISHFNVMKWPDGSYRNMMKRSDCILGEELEEYFGQSVMDLSFTTKNLDALLKMKYQVSSRN